MRNPAVPPVASFTPAFDARALRDALALRGCAEGPARGLALHLLAQLPDERGSDGDLSAASVATEIDALAQAIGPRQTLARATFRAGGPSMAGAGLLALLKERLQMNFDAARLDVVLEARWPGLAWARSWRAVGVSSLVLEDARAADIDAASACGFRSVTNRIVCGRPGQAPGDLLKNLRSMLAAGVERVELHPACTNAGARLTMGRRIARDVACARAVDVLQDGGLRDVGLHLFARPGDPLALALERGRLHLEVDGPCVVPAAGALAVGAGAIGRVGSAYYRNAATAVGHSRAVARDGLSVAVGILLPAAAQARRCAVESLICHGRIDFETLSLAYLVEPAACLARQLRDMAPLVRAGLVCIDDEGLELTREGERRMHLVADVLDSRP